VGLYADGVMGETAGETAWSRRVPDIPHGADARELPLCDLVMKGGVTSGIVYPHAVQQLARQYRFASIGGSSAGAIAAAACAAAELGRQRENGGGMHHLDAVIDELGAEGVLLGLFQPTKGTRRLFCVITSAFLEKASIWKRLRLAAFAACRAQFAIPVIAVILLAGLTALTVSSFHGLPDALAVVIMLVLAVLVVAATVVLAIGLFVWHAVRSLRTSDYGACPGTQQGGRRPPEALIDWLHRHIQACAGRATTDSPLTFRELECEGIRLTMMSTDLGFARPVRVPDGVGSYLFDPSELRPCFPAGIVDAMMPEGARDEDGYQLMPTDDLPVLVAVRLSLSFPFLLSAIPLHDPNPDGDPPAFRHLFSDGGISSNFPIHFFDAWFPAHPTFGIDLVKRRRCDDRPVSMLTNPYEAAPRRLRELSSLPDFVANIVDTAQNWRDNLQSELPGFRDRMCQICLQTGEGGLALKMDPELISRLAGLGQLAGQRILSNFDGAHWQQHLWVRYLTLMGQLQDNLQSADAPYGEFVPALEAGLPDVTVYRTGRDLAWCLSAQMATADLLALARAWGPPPLIIGFGGDDRPLPDPLMRVVPRA
jgi:predicted acylesterase/phospholipase RssA